MGAGGFRDLEVWREGMELALDCYRATEAFPRSERYGLTAQVRSASVSVPANLAEGKSRRHSGDFRRFALIARGSAAELETLLELAARLSYLSDERHAALQERCDHVGRMLSRLAATLVPERKRAGP